MPDLPTWNDLFRIGRDEVLMRNARISRDAVERDGMDANVLVASAAAMGDEVVGQVADLQATLFLESARGAALDHYVFDRYGMVRKPASASIGSVQFSTLTASPATFPIPTGAVLQTSSGTQFITIESTIFGAGTTGPVTVMVRSVLAGSGLNAKIGAINNIVSSIAGAPSNIKINNPYATAGADDAESDDALRDRARRFFTTARRGTLAALESAALNVAGVRKASAIEILDAYGRPARFVQLVVSDAFTEQLVDYTVVPPRYQTQSQALSVAIQNALPDVRAGGIFVQVVVAVVIIQPIQLTLAFNAGADVNTAALQARAAAVNYTNSLAPGVTWLPSGVLSELQKVPGLQYTGNELLSPVGQVVPKPLQVIRTSLGLVSAVAAQTSTPLVTGSNPDAYSLSQG